VYGLKRSCNLKFLAVPLPKISYKINKIVISNYARIQKIVPGKELQIKTVQKTSLSTVITYTVISDVFGEKAGLNYKMGPVNRYLPIMCMKHRSEVMHVNRKKQV
jgi:hypothetical protein